MYNLTNVTESRNLFEIVTAGNELTGGLWASSLLLTVFVISFIASKNYDTEISFLVSSFSTSIIALLFFIIGWIDVTYFSIPVTLLAISIFLVIARK